MKVEIIQSMFPTKNEQRNAQRVLEILMKNYNVDILQISEKISPAKSLSARMAECRGLNRILTDLFALGVIERSQDYYSPNDTTDEALNLMYSLYKAKTRNHPTKNSVPKYLALLCGYCGEIMSARGASKSAICPNCGKKNSLGNTCEILFRADDVIKFQSLIKQEKIKKFGDKFSQ
jgi:uncharacterized CHY-type Zn-finger protein